MQWACLIYASTSLTSSDHYKTPLGYEEIGQHPGDLDPAETRASPTTDENMTWQLCLKWKKERVVGLKRIMDLKAEDKEMVHLDLFGYLVQILLLFTSWISLTNHFLRDVLTHKHSKRCFLSSIQHDRQSYILSVSFMQTMRSGLKLTNYQQFSTVSSDHRNWVKMSNVWYTSFTVAARLRREKSLAVFHVLWRKRKKTTTILAFWTWIQFFGIKFQKKYANINFDKLDMQKFIVIKFKKAWIQALKRRVVYCPHGRSCSISSGSHINVRVRKKSFW